MVSTRKRRHIEVEVDVIPAALVPSLSVPATPSSQEMPATPKKAKTSTPKKRTPIKTPVKRNPPDNWKEIYDLIKVFRDANPAVVDTMGCERLGDDTQSEKVFRFQTLIALMLSSQTKDETTAAAMANLKSHQPGGLTVETVLAMDDRQLDGYICKVGFHNRKTIYIKQAAQIIQDDYDGDIPPTVEKLMELPGVGPKMAYLCMQCAWNKNDGVGVDTHVHRISNRLGWVKTAEKDPEYTRLELESWLPSDYWAQLNPLLVGFGQTLCRPIGPKCTECPAKDLCPKVGTKPRTPKK
ncbi:hypothetical protein SmJEL517_g02208 [Synchytrium microbalum]|uniref:Endonuclease III homolog n=1 Tax=Synchytrium microbalum TaxID=1806994 RepID=A0A507C6W1_9FUNG|nr:uncharacterized protein SmJEL517_g02208 [Synchytrium microbalum]TPX35352.1 hypothetical protein SmJEL517_g02208 [Synchytrium microbalum]